MKKYLMMGAAAMTLSAGFIGCTKDTNLYDPIAAQQQVVETYNEAFVETFGKPDANQDWGFGAAATSRVTRSITVNGDVYDKFPSASDVAAYFPTTIPADADEVADLETLYAGKTIETENGVQTMYGLYHIYAYKIVEGYNLKITQAGTTELGGSYQNAGWDGTQNKNVARPYNVYVNVDGDVTIKRNGSTHFNLYILKGNVTLESDYGEQAGLISVATGATLNDQRNSIAANQGVKMFNRGTVNATHEDKYDIGNFCTVYNEGKFNVTGALTYSPGDANDSYFMNLGDDAELTAASMTLNSTGNFFNSGKVTISGETKVTQARLYWVNAGHYTTGTMTFSAKNTTFYNYCQLIVLGNAHMYDGEFNLMANSYTEAGTAEFDNFIVNMESNTGMYVKGAVKFEAQGDGTYQGFRTAGENDYVLVDGKVTVACHKKTFSVSAGITYSIKQIEIVRNGSVVTEAQLLDEKSGDYPVLDLNGIECPYGDLTVTPNTNSCGANWSRKGDIEPEVSLRVMGEDLSSTEASDFDFNDVVFDVVRVSDTQAKIILRAAGGTLPLRINCNQNGEGGWEVHEEFDVQTATMVNTNAQAKGLNGADREPVELGTVSGDFTVENFNAAVKNINVMVLKSYNGENGPVQKWYPLQAEVGEPASKVGVSTSLKWADERTNVNSAFNFEQWVQNANIQLVSNQ